MNASPTQNTTGAGAIAAQKPIPFYYGEKAEKTPLERIDNLEKQLFNAQEMLATIEADGDFSSHLHGFYVSRVYKLGLKLEDLKRKFPPVFFSVRHFVG
jgi:hypothetical protein